MDRERNNQKNSSVSDATGLSEMPEFNEFRKTIQQGDVQVETPKIQILKYATEKSRGEAERLKKYEVLEPNEWELLVVEQSAAALNQCRQKHGNKLPINKENVKLRIIADETDLSELSGEDNPGGDTGGFTSDNGELYVAGGYRYDKIQMAHIIIHEMTHQFAGVTDRFLLNSEESEAATELVTIEILADLLCDNSISYEPPEEYNTNPKKEGVLKFLQTRYQTYNDYIDNLKQKEQEKNGSFNFDTVKDMLFSGYDRINWGYSKASSDNE